MNNLINSDRKRTIISKHKKKNPYSRPSKPKKYSECSLTSNESTSSIYDVREETILYFYSAMLKCIIKEKEEKLNDTVESIPSCERILIGHTKDSKTSITQETEIEDDDKRNTIKYIRHSSYIKKTKSLNKKFSETSVKRKYKKSSKLNTLNLMSKTRPNIWVIDHVEENVKITFNNGNIYEGTLFCNKLHGQGKFTWPNGIIYEGEFKNNEITGVGRFEFPDKTVYNGDVYKNYRHGSGCLIPSNSSYMYKGDFYFNVKHGFGWQLFGNNNSYEGQWVSDHINGEGWRTYPSGAAYCGKFHMGKRHGYGVAIIKNNDIYAGDWIEGKMDGFGDYIWNAYSENYFTVPVQNSYYGSWVDNKRDGIGVINFGMPGGSRYAGYFCNNDKHGSGVLICENGHVIESEPLFINDKPVHLTSSGNLEYTQSTNNVKKIFSEQVLYSSKTDLMDSCNTTRQELLLKTFPLDKKLPFTTPSSNELSTITVYSNISTKIRQNKSNTEVFKTVFPKIMDQYSSLNIPICVSSEIIDLNAHIYKIIENKTKLQNYQKHQFDNEYFLAYTTSESSSIETYSDYELYKFEEKLMRKTINKYLSQLKRIYYQYAKIDCMDKPTNFKPWMMRIFFWQLYRDCKIHEKGISLIDIDLMLSEKSTFDLYVVHNPFEIIYFWQYLDSLLYVALALYGKEFISSSDGVLKQSFECLMINDILPNAGHFTGSALFEYKDIIPIKAAYAWYKSFGEPHSARQLFKNMYKLKKTKYFTATATNREYLDLPYIRMGRNIIHFGNKVVYYEDEDCILIKPNGKKMKSINYENMKKLYFFSNLKCKKIINIFASVCPAIKQNNDIVRFDYQLCFLEFLEIILQCSRERIKTNVRLASLFTRNVSTQIVKKRKLFSVSRKSKKARG